MTPQLLGWIATALFTVEFIPQIVRTARTKAITGISLSMFAINLMANCVALTYALKISQPPLITKYILGIAATTLYLTIYWRVKRKQV